MRPQLVLVAGFLLCALVLVSVACRQQDDTEARDRQDAELIEYLRFRHSDYGLATHPDTYDVYLIKYQNGKFFKRLILNPEIFDLYELDWDKVRVMEKEALMAIRTSPIVMDPDSKLYYLYSTKDADDGVKQLITLTVDDLVECGFDRDVIYRALHSELDERFYSTMGSVADSCDDLP